MNDQQFERDTEALRHRGYVSFVEAVRTRDTAQREALAQLQAEMPDLRANMIKALDLLQVLTSTKYTDRAFVEAVDEADEMLEQLRGKVVLKGLADLQEAHGAQDGDERISLLERELDRERERADMAEVELQHARAALATQAAAGEPAKYWAFHNEFGELRIEDQWDVAKRLPFDLIPLITVAAPPAAAHGDEAVRKDAEYFRFIESCPIRTGVVLSRKAHEAGFDLRAECDRVMAMRAQGDGEVQ